jgi:hypothetical protein
MSVIDKKIKSLTINPQKDWTIQDLQVVAQRYGIDYRQPGTSHVTFSCSNGGCLTVPAHKPIKPVYVKKFVAMVTRIKGTENDDRLSF